MGAPSVNRTGKTIILQKRRRLSEKRKIVKGVGSCLFKEENSHLSFEHYLMKSDKKEKHGKERRGDGSSSMYYL